MDNLELLPEIKNIILDLLNQLEAKDVDVEMLGFVDTVLLLETHRNKKMIRKIIYDNIGKIINHYVLEIDPNESGNLDYISNLDIGIDLMIEIINDNEEKILKNYSIEEKNKYIDYIKSSANDIYNIAIGKNNMNDLIFFVYSLVINREIVLAKKVFEIIIYQNITILNTIY